MVFSRFTVSIIVRVTLLCLAVTGLGLALVHTGYYAVTLLLVLLSAGLVLELHRFVSRTNLELTRFLDAARYEDFGRHFPVSHAGAGFRELTQTMAGIMEGFRDSRREQEEQLRHLKALTDHVPVPLVSLFADGTLRLRNNAARRLFSGINVKRLEDLQAFGDEAPRALENLEPGRRALVTFVHDGMERRLTAMMTRLTTGNVREKLISLQDIQSELDDVQLQAWQELVRVLTHEIMNSITPVASLAKTARDLMDDLRETPEARLNDDRTREDFEDIRRAVDTVARRSSGLMQFVESYRSLTLLPTPRKRTLVLAEVFQDLRRLTAEAHKQTGIVLELKTDPAGLRLSADPDLLEQVLINLLRNAEQALADCPKPRITVQGRLNGRGHVLIEVMDNGPGLPPDKAGEIFVPFFTTKPGGSGVGLALSRQIMLAHGGNISGQTLPDGGACFTLIF